MTEESEPGRPENPDLSHAGPDFAAASDAAEPEAVWKPKDYSPPSWEPKQYEDAAPAAASPTDGGIPQVGQAEASPGASSVPGSASAGASTSGGQAMNASQAGPFGNPLGGSEPGAAGGPAQPNSQFGSPAAPQPQPAASGPVGPYGEPVTSYGQPTAQPNPAPGYGYDRPAAGYGSQPSYGVPNQGYGVMPHDTYAQIYNQPFVAEHPQASAVLIMGIVGFFMTIPFSFIAWYMGANARKEIAAGAPYRWDGSLQVGYWMGKILSIVCLAGIGIFALMMIIMMIGLTSGY